MTNLKLKEIEQIFELRDPQQRALEIFYQVCNIVLRNQYSNEEIIKEFKKIKPEYNSFERKFPCVCYSMATGIGKTRLMASMIVLLYLEFGITNFMILAPNLTIYEKLIHDFTPNSEKYLFKGILDFEEKLPQIITGDTYEKTATVSRKKSNSNQYF